MQGFQCLNDVLQFFPHAEGYVARQGSSFKYVFQYKDHLGNVRLSYTKNPTTGVTEIIEQSHYYPFVLKHSGYNNTVLPSGNVEAQKISFQEQEIQNELNLNWYSFKWRNYDAAIGRFMSVDPLAEKYQYNSTYAFQENKMGLGRELEGLELVPFSAYGYAIESTLSPTSKEVLAGVKGVVLGTLGAISAGYYIGQSAGIGAALGGGVAFTLSIAEISLGITKIGNALNGTNNYAVSKSNSLPGWIAHSNNAPYAKAIDGVGSFLPGLLTGTWLKDLVAFRTGTVIGALETYDAAEDLNDFDDAMEDFYEGNDAYIDDPNDFFQERPELEVIDIEPIGFVFYQQEIHHGDFTITSDTNPFPDFDNSFPEDGPNSHD